MGNEDGEIHFLGHSCTFGRGLLLEIIGSIQPRIPDCSSINIQSTKCILRISVVAHRSHDWLGRNAERWRLRRQKSTQLPLPLPLVDSIIQALQSTPSQVRSMTNDALVNQPSLPEPKSPEITPIRASLSCAFLFRSSQPNKATR